MRKIVLTSEMIKGVKYLLDDFSKDTGIFEGIKHHENRTSICFIPFGNNKYSVHNGLISFLLEPDTVFYK